MKILAIGDFHGKFPIKLQKLLTKVDLVISTGDYTPGGFDGVFMIQGPDGEIFGIIEGEAHKKHLRKEKQIASKIFKKLNSLKIPVVTVIGNYDNHGTDDTTDKGEGDKDIFSPNLRKYKNIKRIDYKARRVGKLVLIGAYGSSFPGDPSSKAYKRSKKKLSALFTKYKQENREGRLLFVGHNMPYNCRLDVIRDPEASPLVRGEHYGSKLLREIIDKFQPVAFIGGHMHENQGKTKIKKTTIIDAGPAMDGKAAVIDFDEGKGRVKGVEFVN